MAIRFRFVKFAANRQNDKVIRTTENTDKCGYHG